MSAFDITLNVLGTSLAVPDADAQAQGASDLEVHLALGMQLPFSQGGGTPMMAHVGTVKYALDRDTAIKFFEKGLEAAKDLPAPSKLAVATDMSAVAETAEGLEGLR